MNGRAAIGFLPLDTRPCTYDLPVQLARLAGAQVLLPPRGMMGSYKEASPTEELARWLEEAAPRCSALVVSVEQLVHGGLIQSRQPAAPARQLLERLETLRRIRRACPALPIFLSNVVMRTTVSALDPASLVWWEKVQLYSRLWYLEKTGGGAGAAEQLRALEREIPPEVLRTFFAARQANHQLNRACLRLLADGTARQLLLLQEDCAAEGIQRFEQETLRRDIRRLDLEGRAFLFNGTDEAGAELMLRAIRPQGGALEVVWLAGDEDFTALFEDRPFRENLAGHLRALRLRPEPKARQVLFIFAPRSRQRGSPFSPEEADYTEPELAALCRTIARADRQGRRCYLLDLDCANGGCIPLLASLGREMPISRLCGYSAWNTACNSLGTLLAQILADGGRNSPANQGLTADRILDDGLYQALVRQSLAQRLRAAGEDVYNIRDTARAERWLREEFAALEPLARQIFGGEPPAFEASLRWPRLFEAAIFTRSGGGPVFAG